MGRRATGDVQVASFHAAQHVPTSPGSPPSCASSPDLPTERPLCEERDVETPSDATSCDSSEFQHADAEIELAQSTTDTIGPTSALSVLQHDSRSSESEQADPLQPKIEFVTNADNSPASTEAAAPASESANCAAPNADSSDNVSVKDEGSNQDQAVEAATDSPSEKAVWTSSQMKKPDVDKRIQRIKGQDRGDEPEVFEVTSVEASPPEVICLDGDDHATTPQDDDAEASENGIISIHDGDAVGEQPTRRKRKRGRVFSSVRNRGSLAKQKRQTLSIVPAAEPGTSGVALPSAARGRHQHSTEASAESALSQESTPTPAADAVSWDWESCRPYFDSLTQGDMNGLRKLRRECASIVAANSSVWPRTRQLENEEMQFVSMLSDAIEDTDHLRIRSLRRGRSYREVWEEEDFLASHLKPTRSGKKRPFAGCELLTTGRDLVRGYDDDLFRDYLSRLEEHTNAVPTASPLDATAQTEKPSTRRIKNAKRRAVDLDTLPSVPVREVHPASCGSWKLRVKGNDASFEAIHPAALRCPQLRERWTEEWERDASKNQALVVTALRRSGRRDASGDELREETASPEASEGVAAVEERVTDETEELPSFGTLIEEDEISRELENTLTRLVEVSSLNWRQAQTVYERAVTHIELQPLHQADQAGQQRLEALYRKVFPPVDEDADEDEQPRELEFVTRPRHYVAYAALACRDSAEADAVGASVEFAVRLKVGDQVDVLDRNMCWNDGVVTELVMGDGRSLMYVLVSYALWGDAASEWVSIVDGRLLPRGVADGRAQFTMVVGRTRDRLVHLNKDLADLLVRTYPIRISARQPTRPKNSLEGEPTTKKQRRR